MIAIEAVFNDAWIHNIQRHFEQAAEPQIALTSLLPLLLHNVSGKRTAAVLVPLCNRHGQASVLFTVRSQKVSTHKGDVCFPGGHIEEGETAVEAALRETREELGEGIGSIRVLGVAENIVAVTGTLVTPVIAFIETDLQDFAHLSPSADEVDKVFTRSITELSSPAFKVLESYGFLGYQMPVFGPETAERIWGLTACVLDAVLQQAVLPNRI